MAFIVQLPRQIQKAQYWGSIRNFSNHSCEQSEEKARRKLLTTWVCWKSRQALMPVLGLDQHVCATDLVEDLTEQAVRWKVSGGSRSWASFPRQVAARQLVIISPTATFPWLEAAGQGAPGGSKANVHWPGHGNNPGLSLVREIKTLCNSMRGRQACGTTGAVTRAAAGLKWHLVPGGRVGNAGGPIGPRQKVVLNRRAYGAPFDTMYSLQQCPRRQGLLIQHISHS